MDNRYPHFAPRFWPILLIIIGTALLLAKQGVIDLHALRAWWPLILVAVGIRGLFWPRWYRRHADCGRVQAPQKG